MAKKGRIKHNTPAERKSFDNIGDLITFLKKLDPRAIPVSLEPPFTGVRVVLCTSGTVLFSAPPKPKDHPGNLPVSSGIKTKRRK